MVAVGSVPIQKNRGVLPFSHLVERSPWRAHRGLLRYTKRKSAKKAAKEEQEEGSCRRRIQRTGSEVNKIFLLVGVYRGLWQLACVSTGARDEEEEGGKQGERDGAKKPKKEEDEEERRCREGPGKGAESGEKRSNYEGIRWRRARDRVRRARR